jgi:hypothetical protein
LNRSKADTNWRRKEVDPVLARFAHVSKVNEAVP